jgi:hypothetical protein
VKKILIALCSVLILCAGQSSYAHPQTPNKLPQKEIPSYAKWSRLAMQTARAKYPNSSLVDFLHVGRHEKSANLAQETFKLWFKGGHKSEFGVIVKITFEKDTEKVQSVTLEETDQ